MIKCYTCPKMDSSTCNWTRIKKRSKINQENQYCISAWTEERGTVWATRQGPRTLYVAALPFQHKFHSRNGIYTFMLCLNSHTCMHTHTYLQGCNQLPNDHQRDFQSADLIIILSIQMLLAPKILHYCKAFGTRKMQCLCHVHRPTVLSSWSVHFPLPLHPFPYVEWLLHGMCHIEHHATCPQAAAA